MRTSCPTGFQWSDQCWCVCTSFYEPCTCHVHDTSKHHHCHLSVCLANRVPPNSTRVVKYVVQGKHTLPLPWINPFMSEKKRGEIVTVEFFLQLSRHILYISTLLAIWIVLKRCYLCFLGLLSINITWTDSPWLNHKGTCYSSLLRKHFGIHDNPLFQKARKLYSGKCQ